MRILAEFWADLRFAARLLRRSPGFTFVAVSSLALGIGGATAIFTVTDAVVLKSLPVRAPGQLYIAQVEDASGSSSRFSYPLFEQARDVVHGSADMCVSSSVVRMLITEGAAAAPRPDDIGRVQLVSGEYFSVLGTRPQVGRLLEPADNRSIGAHPVAVLSDAFWARRFGRRPDIVNRLITVNGAALTVIGVTPPGFFGTVADNRPDVWVPVMMQSVVRYANNADVENGDLRPAVGSAAGGRMADRRAPRPHRPRPSCRSQTYSPACCNSSSPRGLATARIRTCAGVCRPGMSSSRQAATGCRGCGSSCSPRLRCCSPWSACCW